MHWNTIVNNNRISTISKESKRENPKTTRRVEPNKDRFAYVSLELEKKKRLLDTFKEKNESYEEMQEEISLLTTNYKQLQNKILENSPLHKELIHLANQNKPRNNKPLITDKQWKLIADEITYIYPNLRKYIYSRCPDLPEQDFWYCCLYISGFDTNTEAKLLNITVDSVRKKRLRLRQKLNIILPDNNATLYEYLIENMH